MNVYTLSEIKKIEKKRTGKRKKFWGIVLLALGLIMLEDVFKSGFSISSIIECLIFAVPSISYSPFMYDSMS